MINLALDTEDRSSEGNFENKGMQVSFRLQFCVQFGSGGVVRSYNSFLLEASGHFLYMNCMFVCVNQ